MTEDVHALVPIIPPGEERGGPLVTTEVNGEVVVSVGLPPGRYEPPTQEQLDRHRRIMAYVITRFR